MTGAVPATDHYPTGGQPTATRYPGDVPRQRGRPGPSHRRPRAACAAAGPTAARTRGRRPRSPGQARCPDQGGGLPRRRPATHLSGGFEQDGAPGRARPSGSGCQARPWRPGRPSRRPWPGRPATHDRPPRRRRGRAPRSRAGAAGRASGPTGGRRPRPCAHASRCGPAPPAAMERVGSGLTSEAAARAARPCGPRPGRRSRSTSSTGTLARRWPAPTQARARRSPSPTWATRSATSRASCWHRRRPGAAEPGQQGAEAPVGVLDGRQQPGRRRQGAGHCPTTSAHAPQTRGEHAAQKAERSQVGSSPTKPTSARTAARAPKAAAPTHARCLLPLSPTARLVAPRVLPGAACVPSAAS